MFLTFLEQILLLVLVVVIASFCRILSRKQQIHDRSVAVLARLASEKGEVLSRDQSLEKI